MSLHVQLLQIAMGRSASAVHSVHRRSAVHIDGHGSVYLRQTGAAAVDDIYGSAVDCDRHISIGNRAVPRPGIAGSSTAAEYIGHPAALDRHCSALARAVRFPGVTSSKNIQILLRQILGASNCYQKLVIVRQVRLVVSIHHNASALSKIDVAQRSFRHIRGNGNIVRHRQALEPFCKIHPVAGGALGQLGHAAACK